MMNLGLSAAIVFLLTTMTACQPADKKVKSVKDRLEAGEVVEFTKPGYRRPSCTDRQPDWTDIRLSDESERERIVTKTQSSSLNPGKHSCFRVGSVIELNSPAKRSGAGQARITKISIVQLDKLQQRNLKGTFFSKSDDFGRYKDNYKFRLKAADEGIVTIVDFEYLAGSAPDELALKEKVKRESEGDGYSETIADGTTISACRNAWTELLAPEVFHEPLLKGTLGSFYRVGDLNCLKQGALAELKTKQGEPAKGMLKVLKIKKFRVTFVDAKFFQLKEFPFADLSRAIKDDVDRMSKGDRGAPEWITVIDVEPATASVMEGVRP